jgi:Sensors of blue-light using FAD
MSCLVYVSRAKECYQHGGKLLAELEKKAALRNQKSALTGILIFSNGYFVQMLEGDDAKLVETFERIRRDDSHTDVEMIAYENVDCKMFSSWSMNLIELHETPLETKQRVNNLFELVKTKPTTRCRDVLEMFITPRY